MPNLAQRPVIGLQDVKYALLDEASDISGGTPTWGTIYSLANAIDLSFDPASSASTLFADNGPAFIGETVGEMKVTLNVADLLPSHVARLLGQTYTNGEIVEASTDQSPYVAIGGKVLRSGALSGNPVYEYIWLYKVRFTKPSAAMHTKEASINFQTPSLEGRVVQLTANKYYKIRIRTDDDDANATTLTNFFNQVTLPAADTNVLAVTIAEGTGGDAGKIKLTFAKTGGGNFIISSTTVTASNIIIGTASGIEAGTFSTPSTTPAASQIIYFTPDTPWAGSTDVAAAVTSNVRDDNNVGCTTTIDIVTIA